MSPLGVNAAFKAVLDQLLGLSGLPDPLPDDPMALFGLWFKEAKESGRYADANAMVLATTTREGQPSARVVLCKAVDPDAGAIVFYTNYNSRKGLELESNPRCAAVFHWHDVGRQVRMEGVVTKVSDQDSDAYFASRPLLSRLGAWVSAQSQPLAKRSDLVAKTAEVMSRFKVAPQWLLSGGTNVDIPRPPHWGGYCLRLQRIELWVGGGGRLHDRAAWTRSDGPWSASRLQP